MSCRAMAFSMMVLRISFTLSRALRMPGMNPQSGAGQEADDHGGGDEEPARPRAEEQGKPGRHQRAGDDLALSADIDHVRAERDADPQPHQEQGRGLDERLGEAERRSHGAVDQRRIGGKRVCLQDDQHDGAEEEREDDADHGQQDVQRDPAPVDGRTVSPLRAL